MEFIVDRSKWRCGGAVNSKLQYEEKKYAKGLGDVAMSNEKGYMCCLGHCMTQLHDKIKVATMIDCEFPEDVMPRVNKVDNIIEDNIFAFSIKDENSSTKYYYNTRLSQLAADINDDSNLTAKEREAKLKRLFRKNGHSIKFINKTVKFKDKRYE